MDYVLKDYRYFPTSEVEKKFPGSSVYLGMKHLKPPMFNFVGSGECYEENSFRSWLEFVKKQQGKAI